ncbi:hypothetical protein ACIQ7L_15950, partial [Bacillus sp. NPDC094106]
FTSHGAEKGTDRFYAWPDALSRLRKGGFVGFLIDVYISKTIPTTPMILVLLIYRSLPFYINPF